MILLSQHCTLLLSELLLLITTLSITWIFSILLLLSLVVILPSLALIALLILRLLHLIFDIRNAHTLLTLIITLLQLPRISLWVLATGIRCILARICLCILQLYHLGSLRTALTWAWDLVDLDPCVIRRVFILRRKQILQAIDCMLMNHFLSANTWASTASSFRDVNVFILFLSCNSKLNMLLCTLASALRVWRYELQIAAASNFRV